MRGNFYVAEKERFTSPSKEVMNTNSTLPLVWKLRLKWRALEPQLEWHSQVPPQGTAWSQYWTPLRATVICQPFLHQILDLFSIQRRKKKQKYKKWKMQLKTWNKLFPCLPQFETDKGVCSREHLYLLFPPYLPKKGFIFGQFPHPYLSSNQSIWRYISN